MGQNVFFFFFSFPIFIKSLVGLGQILLARGPIPRPTLVHTFHFLDYKSPTPKAPSTSHFLPLRLVFYSQLSCLPIKHECVQRSNLLLLLPSKRNSGGRLRFVLKREASYFSVQTRPPPLFSPKLPENSHQPLQDLRF